jgi:anti-sigma B factor antagonist
VAGELDLATAGQFEAALRAAIGAARLVLLDMRGVSFMDSTGLRAILDATERARAQGGRLVVAGASAQIETLLDITGTRAHLDVLTLTHHTEESASHADEDRIRPLENPVNARVVVARVIASPEARVWVETSEGAIHKPWAPRWSLSTSATTTASPCRPSPCS